MRCLGVLLAVAVNSVEAPAHERASQGAASRRDEEIASVQQLLVQPGEPATRAELLFRLSALEWEKAEATHAEELAAFDDDTNRWRGCLSAHAGRACVDHRPSADAGLVEADWDAMRQDRWGREEAWARAAGERKDCPELLSPAKCGPEPQVDVHASESIRLAALDRLRLILRTYPDFVRNDAVRLALGKRLLESPGRSTPSLEGVEVLQALTERHPQSDLVALARLALCDVFLQRRDLSGAETACSAAARMHDVRTEGRSLFKLGWVRYNAGRWGAPKTDFPDECDPICLFQQVVETQQGILTLHSLRTEALDALVKSFIKFGDRDTAIQYFVAQEGKGLAVRYINHLAHGYARAGGSSWQDARFTFEWLRDQYPFDRNAATWQIYIVMALDHTVSRDNLAAVRRLVRDYLDATDWRERQAWTVRDESSRKIADFLALWGEDYFAEAKKTRGLKAVQRGQEFLSLFLSHFPLDERMHRLRFRYAELLEQGGDAERAYDSYFRVAVSGTGELRTNAARRLLALAFERNADVLAACDLSRAVMSQPSPEDEALFKRCPTP